MSKNIEILTHKNHSVMAHNCKNVPKNILKSIP